MVAKLSSVNDQYWTNMSYKLCSCLTTGRRAPGLAREVNVTYATQSSDILDCEHRRIKTQGLAKTFWTNVYSRGLPMLDFWRICAGS